MFAIINERVGEVLAGEHLTARHLRHRAGTCREAFRCLRQILREPDPHGQSIAAVTVETCLHQRFEKVCIN